MPNATDTASATVTRDAFLGGALMLYQPAKGYRAGIDAVLLAACVSGSRSGEQSKLLDVGAGVGTIGLCAAVRLPNVDVTMVERVPELAGLARENIQENALGGRARVVELDLLARADPSVDGVPDNAFDVVVSNPPYYEQGRHRRSPNALKAASHDLAEGSLDRWFRFMARKCRAGGSAIVIFPAQHLGELLEVFTPRFGAVQVLPLHSRPGEPAKRVIVFGTKGSRAPLSLLPGLVLHDPDNQYRPEVDRVLKAPLPLLFDSETTIGG